MVDRDKFEDKKNEGKIIENLDAMAKLVKNIKHTSITKAPGLRLSKQVLEDHLADTARVFKVGNKDYARWALNSTFSICMSCHTQSTSESRNWSLIGFKEFGNDFDHAEFLFAARDFDHALEKYDLIIDGFPANKIRIMDLEKAISRKVAVFARVKRDFKGGLASVQKSQQNEELPPYLSKNLLAWEATFREAMKTPYPDPRESTDEQIRTYVEAEMKKGLWDKMIEASNPRLVTNLTVSGILYEYLNLHPTTPLRPDILYWLALCDRSLNNNFFYSLSDLYLKECINDFPKSPVAQKCFEEYEANTTFSYTGSSGVHVPKKVRDELDELRKKVNGPAKK